LPPARSPGTEGDFAGITRASSGLVDGTVDLAPHRNALLSSGAPIPIPVRVVGDHAPADSAAQPPTLWDSKHHGLVRLAAPDTTTITWRGFAVDSATAPRRERIQGAYGQWSFETADHGVGSARSASVLHFEEMTAPPVIQIEAPDYLRAMQASSTSSLSLTARVHPARPSINHAIPLPSGDGVQVPDAQKRATCPRKPWAFAPGDFVFHRRDGRPAAASVTRRRGHRR